MSKINVTIDDLKIEVEEGTTILEAANMLDIYIPTLCHHPDQFVKANCRICVSEIVGMKLLVPSCAYPLYDGAVVKTHSPRVRLARRNILELILARHAQDCLHCDRNNNCELQTVSEKMHFLRTPRYPYAKRSDHWDDSSPSIIRNSMKCIACGRCEYVCSEIQTVHALSKEGRGFKLNFKPAYGKTLAESVCVNCGQCVQACPTGALTINDSTQRVWRAIADEKKQVIAQVAPAVRITIAEALGEDVGTVSTGRLVTALKRLGFDKVFDTNFTADLTIIEEGTELIKRINNNGVLPLITSCSPAWIKFLETFYPQNIPNLSTCKSPQAMFGTLIKTYYKEKINANIEDIYSVSVMPCTAKKFEANRPEFTTDGVKDIDSVITVQELARMIKSAGITFKSLPETEFDVPFGLGSGAGEIFGVTGGVMEASLRSVYEILTNKELEKLEFHDLRGFDGIKEASVFINDLEVKVAIAHGLGNARKLMNAINDNKVNYHFVEIMACPGGCIGGGGNPIKNWKKMDSRLEAIYKVDDSSILRKSHLNPNVKELYDTYLGEAGGTLAHKLLHTSYISRKK